MSNELALAIDRGMYDLCEVALALARASNPVYVVDNPGMNGCPWLMPSNTGYGLGYRTRIRWATFLR